MCFLAPASLGELVKSPARFGAVLPMLCFGCVEPAMCPHEFRDRLEICWATWKDVVVGSLVVIRWKAMVISELVKHQTKDMNLWLVVWLPFLAFSH